MPDPGGVLGERPNAKTGGKYNSKYYSKADNAVNRMNDHNADYWLAVRHLDERPHSAGPWHGPGWYVVRTCPCHADVPVTLPLKSIVDAYRAKAAMLAVSGN